MIYAFRLHVLLLALSPLFLAADNLLLHGILAAYVCLVTLIVAWSIRPGEASFLAKIIRPAMFVALVPALWLVAQALPVPFSSLHHPIWLSALTALDKPIWGSISISPGATLISLGRYLSACGLFFVATAVSIDRVRAEIILLWLAAITTVLALGAIVNDLDGFLFLAELGSIGRAASVTTASTLGTVLAAATAVYAFERYETRRSGTDSSGTRYIVTIITAIGGLAVCWIVIAFFQSDEAIFAALSGTGAFILIVGLRRLGVGPRMGLIVAAVIVAIPISIFAKDLLPKGADPTLRFDTEATKSLIDLTQRIITDTSWAGSGAGTFAALLPIYQDTSNVITVPAAPTTAAGMIIELGPVAFWIIVIAALAAIAWLVHGALQRGRDSFFSAAAASCGLVLLIEAFVDASLAGSTTIIIATTILGLGLSQSVSRTSH